MDAYNSTATIKFKTSWYIFQSSLCVIFPKSLAVSINIWSIILFINTNFLHFADWPIFCYPQFFILTLRIRATNGIACRIGIGERFYLKSGGQIPGKRGLLLINVVQLVAFFVDSPFVLLIITALQMDSLKYNFNAFRLVILFYFNCSAIFGPKPLNSPKFSSP